MAFLGSMIAQASTRQRAARHRTLIKASVSGLKLANQPVLVRNVSDMGLGMTAQGQLPEAGQKLSIRFASGLWVAGRVAWVEGKAFGVALDQPLGRAELEAATQRQSAPLAQAIAWHVEQAFAPREAAPRACYL